MAVVLTYVDRSVVSHLAWRLAISEHAVLWVLLEFLIVRNSFGVVIF